MYSITFFLKEYISKLTKNLFPVSYRRGFNCCTVLELMLAINSHSLETFQILFSLSLSSVLIKKKLLKKINVAFTYLEYKQNLLSNIYEISPQ